MKNYWDNEQQQTTREMLQSLSLAQIIIDKIFKVVDKSLCMSSKYE